MCTNCNRKFHSVSVLESHISDKDEKCRVPDTTDKLSECGRVFVLQIDLGLPTNTLSDHVSCQKVEQEFIELSSLKDYIKTPTLPQVGLLPTDDALQHLDYVCRCSDCVINQGQLNELWAALY